ncbi:MAG TPA: hypothetical protein VM638_06985 [Actinomycetota bacterium]|nr:hypothetical protein [Actinomycetota bacterium]
MPRAASRAPLALAAATLGFLTVVAASQEPTPARATRRLGFVDLIREQDERISTLRAEVSELERRVGRSRATASAGSCGRSDGSTSDRAGRPCAALESS